jgi:dTDP-4-dehydrorhamnose reductase
VKKIIITGSNGLLGQKLVSLFCEHNFKVIALSKGENRLHKITNFTYYDTDITDASRLTALLKKEQPDIIINSAAMTNVDACEDHKLECDALNVDAVATLVNYCKTQQTHLVHISTDFIFDGTKGNYKEDDSPNPLNYYGLSKLKSEAIIKTAKIDFTILRTILVYGLVENPNRSNIVLWVKNTLENKKDINVITDQYRMPTLSNELAQACLLSVQKRVKGVFHISSNQLLSIYDIALQVAEVFELDSKWIHKTTTEALNQKAKRPPKTGFNLEKSIEELDFKPKSFKASLQDFKRELLGE